MGSRSNGKATSKITVLSLSLSLSLASHGCYSLLYHIRNFDTGCGYSLLWPKATTFLSQRRAYSRPEVAIVACGQRPQGLISTISLYLSPASHSCYTISLPLPLFLSLSLSLSPASHGC